MENKEEKNKCDCVNKSICDEELDKVVGGGMVTPFKKECTYHKVFNSVKNSPEKKEVIKAVYKSCIANKIRGYKCDEDCELYKLDVDSLLDSL